MKLFSKWKQRIAERREEKELDKIMHRMDDYEVTDEGHRLIDYLNDPEAGASYHIEVFEDMIMDLQNKTGHSREQVKFILLGLLTLLNANQAE